jgi:hypothetical protein
MSTLAIESDTVCYLIVLARQFGAKVAPAIPDPGSNATDDGFQNVLEDRANDAVVSEMRQFLRALDAEEYVNLLALMWLGRGDYAIEEWDDAIAEAQSLSAERGPDYLIGTPLLSDYLEEGLTAFDRSCTDFEKGRL